MEEVLFSPGLVVLALNVALATIVVGLAAVIVGKLARRALLPVRHGMLCLAMLLILSCPLPVWIAAQCQLGLVPICLPAFESAEADSFSAVMPMNGNLSNLPTHSEVGQSLANAAELSESAAELDKLAAEPGAIDNVSVVSEDIEIALANSFADADWLPTVLLIAGSLFLAVWVAVGIWFAGRLVYGLVVVRRLGRSLRPATDARLIEAAQKVFAAAGAPSAARIAESPMAPAPLTLGWFRAAIVVPDGLASALTDEQLSSMLAHELAHVQRRDTLIGLAQQLAAAAFWWNPFVHAVNRQINRLRERLCDDFAAIQNGHGVALAQALVRVAEWSAARTRPSPLTSGLLEDFSDLEERVQRLTEERRTASSHLSRKSISALGGFGLLLGSLLMLPILRAEEDESDSFPVDAFTGTIAGNGRPEPDVDRNADGRGVQLAEPTPISVSGQVRTMDKKPVAGAKVSLLSFYGNNEFHAADEPLAVTHTDAEGRYQFHNIALPTIQIGQARPPSGMFQVCGEKEGFGIAWHGCRHYSPRPRPADFLKIDQDNEFYQGEAIAMDLTLRPARTLAGRIIDDQDQPVANATIQLRELDYLDTGGHEHHETYREFRLLDLAPPRFHQAQTGADGRFEIQGLPAESVARVVVEHPDFAEQWLLAAITDKPVTENRYIANGMTTIRNDRQVSDPIWETRTVQTSPVEIRARGTRRIFVDVVHEDDGAPAAGVTVSAMSAKGNFEASSSGKTDEQGRAALKLPPGEYNVFVLPIEKSDYLRTKRDVTVADQPGEQTFKLPLEKGCLLTLEVVDAVTGKGIPGISFVKAVPVGTRQGNFIITYLGTSHITNASGECRAIVAPGIQRYGIAYVEGYEDFNPFARKQVACEAGKTARLQFKLTQ
jgi:beta-lactamase regulating signal transducer with metallopeptidase domain/5-hydroxyisourate hydrolase-like protein (transthyretin family)